MQGVGFRPFVYRLAHRARARRLGAQRRRRRDHRGRRATPRALDALVAPPARRGAAARARRRGRAPGPAARAARRRRAASRSSRARGGARGDGDRRPTAPICADCLAELLRPGRPPLPLRVHQLHALRAALHDHARAALRPRDDQHGGVRAVPGVRAPSTASPRDRRFHAEPNACPACGPRLALRRRATAPRRRRRPDRRDASRGSRAARSSRSRAWAASTSPATRATPPRSRALRARKHARGEAVRGDGRRTPASLAALRRRRRRRGARCSRRAERPIVLLRKRAGADDALPGVAPGLAWLGVMLPYTPLQLPAVPRGGGPARRHRRGSTQPQALVLVMTSANPGGEPLVTGNDEALRAARRHRRRVPACTTATSSSRCDDSVLRALPARRRGSAVRPPRARLHAARDPARRAPARRCSRVGGYFKNTVCVTRGDEAFVSQHVGDLDNAPTCAALERDGRAPRRRSSTSSRRLVAHDLHPDFFSTRLAARLAGALAACRRCAVQHHHAHIAAVLAEHRVDGPVLGLALDGVGPRHRRRAPGAASCCASTARAASGSATCARCALPGGDRAAREPWRMAAAALRAGRPRRRDRARASPTSRRRATVAAMLARGVHAPATQQHGPLVRRRRRPARRARGAWPSRARRRCCSKASPSAHGPVAADAGAVRDRGRTTSSTSLPLVARLADERDAGLRRRAVPRDAGRRRWPTGSRGAARDAGVCHRRLRRRLLPQRDRSPRGLRARARARAASRCSKPQAVPPNDGGLALGQAWVAPLHDR